MNSEKPTSSTSKDKTPKMESVKIDRIDLKILKIIQENDDLSMAQLAGKVGLSPTPCWNRVQKLTHAGVIEKRVAVLNPQKIGINTTVFVQIKAQHSKQWLQDFEGIIRQFPEVTEAYRMSGEVDYLIKVQVSSIEHFDRFYKELVSQIPVDKVTSSFALDPIKKTMSLDLGPLSDKVNSMIASKKSPKFSD